MTDEFQEIERLFASLPDREAREDVLRILAREAARTAPDCLNGTSIPEAMPQKNSRRPMDEEVI